MNTEDFFERIVSTSLAYNAQEPGDYFDAEGILRCGKCGGRKQADKLLPGVEALGTQPRMVRVGVACPCRQQRISAEEAHRREQEHRQRVVHLRKKGTADPAFASCTFESDDGSRKAVTNMCRKYVAEWAEMKRENIGILFYGGVGTGKSFYAGCIANALIEREISAYMAPLPTILNRLQKADADGMETYLADLQRVSLMVLDDLGAERDTSYSTEQAYCVVDARYRAKKPLIVTTNLSLEFLERADLSMGYKRIYDRVLEMCPIRIALTGPSKRVEAANRRRDLARSIMVGERPER